MSVDLRTRTDAEQAPVDASTLFGEILPDRFDAEQAGIAPGAAALGLGADDPSRIEVAHV